MTGVNRGKALLYAILAAIVGGVGFAIAVRTTLGQRTEQNVLGASDFANDSPLLGLVSVPTFGIALAVVAAIAWMFRGFARALWIVIFGAAAVLGSQLLKYQWLDRPALGDFDAPNTFPSGHMTVFTVVVAGLIWAVPRAARGIVTIGGAALLGAVSWQLLSLGWHRPSDVLGALALVVFSYSVGAAIRPSYAGHTVREPRDGGRVFNKVLGVITVVAGWVLAIGGLALVVLAGAISSDSLLLGGSEIALVGASALACAAFMRLGR